jgi:ERCC4-type nuclease
MLNLVYDSRELKLKELLEPTNTINLCQEHLDLGDIIFRDDTKDILVIERKTMSDLYSSIQDGRYKEQKIRLMNHYSREQIVYIIEGTISSSSKFFKKAKPITDGALLNMAFRDKLTVIRTKDIAETASILYKIGGKIIKNPEFFKNENDSEKESNISKINYLDTIKICKKDNMTPKLCNIVQLSQIPGVSKQMGETIIEKYGSLSNLILEYNKIIEDKDKLELLKNIELTNRKIGPVISKRIYEFLFF